MITDLRPHARYKDSGLPWLPRVPEHWHIRRAKSVLREIDRRSTTGAEPLLSLRMNAGLVDHHALGGRHVPASALIGYKKIRPGEIVMNRMRAAMGLFAVARSNGLVSPDYAIFISASELNAEYAVRLFKTPTMMSLFRLESRGLGTGEAGFLRLYTDRFGMIPLPMPPVHEQAAIVRFLDWATSRIDCAIRANRKVIALLNEQKQAIIRRAVTCGVNSGVPFRRSGNPWLGDIPAHWELRRLKHAFKRIVGGSTPSSSNPAFWNGDVVWITPGDISKSALLIDSSRRISRRGLEACSTEMVPADSIVLTSRAPVGNVALARVPLCTNQGCKALIPDTSRLVPMFGFWVLTIMKEEIQGRATGTTFTEISTAKLGAITMPLPSLHEQERILAFIASETESIDHGVTGLALEIDLLHEYRTRLVADVVTGQLDVRAVAARLPDEAPPDVADPDVAEYHATAEEEAVA